MISHDALVREFLAYIHERAAECFKGKIEQAFVAWYIEAEFGKSIGDGWKFPDGGYDGGIDAIVWHETGKCPVTILQFKFTKNVCATKLGSGAYERFHEIVDLLYDRDDEKITDWLDTVHEAARADYRKAYRQLREVGHWATKKKAFRLVTCANGNLGSESGRLADGAYCYGDQVIELYRHFRSVGMPRPDPLRLTADKVIRQRSHGGKYESLLFNAKVTEFKHYLERVDVPRVVARNIRFNLGKQIGKRIRATYENAPEDFWYLHNGISIVCDSLIRRDGSLVLANPSVINGAQTLYAIHGSNKTSKTARVTVRVVVRGRQSELHQDDDAWLQGVIRGVNTQNKVQSLDFFSNEPEQFELQRLFNRQSVYYERKRGEWNNVKNEAKYRSFRRLSLITISQILTAVDQQDGRGVLIVKRGMEKAFQDRKLYDALFNSKKTVRYKFKRIYLAYRLYRFLRDAGYPNPSIQRKQRHAFWNTLWIAHLLLNSSTGIPADCTVESIRTAFDEFDRRSSVGRNARKVARLLTSSVWKTFRKSPSKNGERWSANNFFKEAYGNKRVLRLVPAMRSEFAVLAKHLQA